ncbi:hypothetical protein NPIL_69871 [Nephila pilipes]|uniref:Uncharacterized protein n=1 Tax=Nephila pilipes TaxID=299642 RepID=A0A8X6U193_NEPPI|nr:hypothetical protein NPIL_69871 [Nephila pilipes]
MSAYEEKQRNQRVVNLPDVSQNRKNKFVYVLKQHDYECLQSKLQYVISAPAWMDDSHFRQMRRLFSLVGRSAFFEPTGSKQSCHIKVINPLIGVGKPPAAKAYLFL